jgi:hypothetical protein
MTALSKEGLSKTKKKFVYLFTRFSQKAARKIVPSELTGIAATYLFQFLPLIDLEQSNRLPFLMSNLGLLQYVFPQFDII